MRKARKKKHNQYYNVRNDREREKKRSGSRGQKKKLCYAHRIINCRERTEFFFKKKKRRRRRDTTNGRIMIWQRVKGKSGKKENENQ